MNKPIDAALIMFDFNGMITSDSFKDFLVWAANNNVSDIHIQGGNEIIIDRHGRKIKASPFRVADDVLSKILDDVFDAQLRANIRGGTPQDRPFQLDGDKNNRYGLGQGERLRFRVNAVQATAAQMVSTSAITMRVIPTKIPDIKQMDIEADLFEAILPHKGLGLVCGETGSGKSTLLASIYRYCADKYPDRKITTAEDPIEYVIGKNEDILPATQLQIGKDVKSFSEAIRAALRRAPSIIGVGEMRDSATIKAAILSGLLGHLCLSTLHTDSPGETIPRMLSEIPYEIREATARDLLGVLQYIVVQRLLRTTDGKRQAVREYIVFDQSLRDELSTKSYTDWGYHINAIIRTQKRRIADKAFALFLEGRIDRDEILTVVSPGELRNMEKLHEET